MSRKRNYNVFEIGQKVTTKQTGCPTVGYVVGIIHGLSWEINTQYTGQTYTRWYELYPDWPNKPVYFVMFDEPHRTISFDEWCAIIEPQHRDLNTYEEHVPIQAMASYPHDDLEDMGEEERFEVRWSDDHKEGDL